VRRRLLAAVAALLLLGVGTAVLVTWVNGAENRALAGVQTVRVLVADQVIPEGTPADQLADLVRVDVLPSKAALAGRVTDISALAGQLATVDLQPGEQLLSSRFARPDDLQAPGTVAVPEGMQEVSVLLEPQRAVGGRLAAGDTVGVLVSIDEEKKGQMTHAVLHDVLVTEV
jgi:pilus assembly protein CpaB